MTEEDSKSSRGFPKSSSTVKGHVQEYSKRLDVVGRPTASATVNWCSLKNSRGVVSIGREESEQRKTPNHSQSWQFILRTCAKLLPRVLCLAPREDSAPDLGLSTNQKGSCPSALLSCRRKRPFATSISSNSVLKSETVKPSSSGRYSNMVDSFHRLK